MPLIYASANGSSQSWVKQTSHLGGVILILPIQTTHTVPHFKSACKVFFAHNKVLMQTDICIKRLLGGIIYTTADQLIMLCCFNGSMEAQISLPGARSFLELDLIWHQKEQRSSGPRASQHHSLRSVLHQEHKVQQKELQNSSEDFIPQTNQQMKRKTFENCKKLPQTNRWIL